jgi:hypothetical protein
MTSRHRAHLIPPFCLEVSTRRFQSHHRSQVGILCLRNYSPGWLLQCLTFVPNATRNINGTLSGTCLTNRTFGLKCDSFGLKWDIQKSAIHKDVPPREATCGSRNNKRFLSPRWWDIFAPLRTRLGGVAEIGSYDPCSCKSFIRCHLLFAHQGLAEVDGGLLKRAT